MKMVSNTYWSLAAVLATQALTANAQITLEEIAQHATPDDCWTGVYGVVYDVTDYAPMHPVGALILTNAMCGQDGTIAFDGPHGDTPDYMTMFPEITRQGDLVDPTPAPTAAPETPSPTAAPETPSPTAAPETPSPTAAPETPEPTSTPATPEPTTTPATREPTGTPETPAPVPGTPAPVPLTPVPVTTPVPIPAIPAPVMPVMPTCYYDSSDSSDSSDEDGCYRKMLRG